MPLFTRGRKGRDVSAASSVAPSPLIEDVPQFTPPKEPAPQAEEVRDPWTRREVLAEEVQELLHICTEEMKSRALDMPFLLLPYRPFFSDPIAAKTFIRKFIATSSTTRSRHSGKGLVHELKLLEPMAICSVVKWCWSRLKGGVVTWNTYKLFQAGEQKSNMAKNSFPTFIPLSVESEARTHIVFDFFDLLGAIAANSKTNGLGGRKLSRLAGWWAFDHSSVDNSFAGGYNSWARAADATSHLFFAFLRSLASDSKLNGGISKLPRSLEALVAETEYPPETPLPLQSSTIKISMLVDSPSNTPFSQVRRAKNLEYGFSRYDDPTKALTAECRRVLDCISSATHPASLQPEAPVGSRTDASWLRFEDVGFSSVLDGSKGNETAQSSNTSTPSKPATRVVRTISNPSWDEFLTSGFTDDGVVPDPKSLTLPTKEILPPLSSSPQKAKSPLTRTLSDNMEEAGELDKRDRIALDETFWWVWMTSLAEEETPTRRELFERCVTLETEISGRRWLILEERVRAIAPDVPSEPEDEPVVVEKETEKEREKKSKFSFGKRTRARQASNTQKSAEETVAVQEEQVVVRPESPELARDRQDQPGEAQQAKVQAAAAALVQEQADKIFARDLRRRGRKDDDAQSKTSSVLTMQPIIAKDAGPALQWARRFDKEVIRAKYLGDTYAGRGQLRELSPTNTMMQNSAFRSFSAPMLGALERELPLLPKQSDASLSTSAKNEPWMKPTTRDLSDAHLQAGRTSADAKGDFSPLPSRTDAPTSLVPSPLAPRRKPVSGDFTTKLQEQNDSSESRSSASDRLDPFTPGTPRGAAAQSDTSPELTPHEPAMIKRKPSMRGFKKLFGKRVVSEPTAGMDVRRDHMEVKSEVQQPVKMSRKRSFLRRKNQPPPLDTTGATKGQQLSPVKDSPIVHPAPIKQSPVIHDTTASEILDGDAGEPAPVVTGRAPSSFEEARTDIYATVPAGGELKSPTFSGFTQGRVDNGSVTNYESDNESFRQSLPAPQPRRGSSPTQFHTRAALLLMRDAEMAKASMPINGTSDGTVPELRNGHPVQQNDAQDSNRNTWGATRWAAIKENAARRVSEEERVSLEKEKALQSHPKAESVARAGPEQAAGEESIEARVARIKARVAELTGSGTASPSIPQTNFSRY